MFRYKKLLKEIDLIFCPVQVGFTVFATKSRKFIQNTMLINSTEKSTQLVYLTGRSHSLSDLIFNWQTHRFLSYAIKFAG